MLNLKKNNENFNLITIKPGFVDAKMTNNIKVGVPLKWKIIMSILKLIPVFIFKK